MSLKDKVKKWYPNRGIATALDKPHYFDEDVRKVVLDFIEADLIYSPNKKKCTDCGIERNIFYEKWNHNRYKLYVNCQKCYLKRIFGDFEK